MQIPFRHLPLEGGLNFRDIGGLATVEGRSVRHGHVYRAGVLSHFTPADSERLAGLGVRAICDLRRADERAREPTRWPGTDVALLDWPDGDSAPAVTGRLAPRQPDAASMRAAMIAMYRELPRWMVPRMQGFLGCVVAERMPVVVHCSAGKDRTGFAVAMLLSALGVHRDQIMQDYLYTNDVGDLEAFIQRRYGSQLGVADGRRPLSGMEPDVRRVLLAADADYLQAALEQVEAEFGGVAAYLQQAVGLMPAQLARLQAVLLA